MLAAVLATAIVAPSATASPGLAVGAVENQLLWNTADTVAVARYLGLRTIGVNLDWDARLDDLDATQITALNRAVTAAGSLRIVLSMHGNWQQAPTDEASRQRYCTFAANALRRYPQINDIIVWNEPNVGFFWQPAVRCERRERVAEGVPRARRTLLRRSPRRPAERERHRPGELALGQRQPERLLERDPLAPALHQRARRGVPRERPHAADLRHPRTPSVSA